MSWASISSNQAVTGNNLIDAVSLGIFAGKSSIPATNECITKAEADTYVYINTAKASYSAKASNQLVVKNDLEAANPVMFVTTSGLYPVTGPLSTTTGLLYNLTNATIYYILSFNSGGVGSGTLNNDTLSISGNSIVLNGKVITSFGQTITSANNTPLYSGVLVLTAYSNVNVTLDKFDGFGSGSTLRIAYGSTNTGPFTNI
jgi:hypothetical protein